MADYNSSILATASDLAVDPCDLGGSGASISYLMRGYGSVSAAQVYWTSATPDDADAPEAVSNVSIVKIL